MLSIEVNSLPIADVIADIANAFDVDFTEMCGEFYIDIPENLGKGNIRGISFDSGMGIVQYDCIFNQDVEFRFTVNEVHPLKFLYCLEGLLEHRFENTNESHKIGQYQEAIVSSDFVNGHILHFDAEDHTVVNSLEITRSVFQKKIKCDLVTMDETLQGLFNDINAEKTFYHDGFYSLKLADLFREMQSFEGQDFLRKLFLEGKAYQMLTTQIMQFEDDLSDVSNRRILRQSEVAQIKKAVQFINERIEQLDNIDQIAYEVGLNANKLQEGFQNLFGLTVNQFIQRVRLNLIMDMVLNTDYSISEIVHMVGLSSKSYLSKIFKEEYGTSPSEYRKHFIDSLNKKRNKDK